MSCPMQRLVSDTGSIVQYAECSVDSCRAIFKIRTDICSECVNSEYVSTAD